MSDHGIVPPDLVFRWTAHHVRQIFVALLPKAYVLDGSGVVQLTCGPRGSDPQYQSMLGASNYYVDPFDFSSYRAASGEQREELLLTLVETSLSDIAQRGGVDDSAIRDTADRVRRAAFRHTSEIKKLGLKLPSGRRIKVLRSLSREQGEAWLLRLLSANGECVGERAMDVQPNYLDRRDYFASARVDATDFVVRTRAPVHESFRCSLVLLEGAQAG